MCLGIALPSSSDLAHFTPAPDAQPIPPKIELERDALYGEKEGGKDLYPNADGVFELFSNEQYTAYAAPMKHTIPCVGYMVKEATQPGHIEPAMIQDIVYRNAQAIKEKYEFRDARMIFRLIKNEYKEGGVFTFPGDGTTVKYDDIMEPERPGRKVVILGDTCDAGAMAHLAQGADIVIHEATNTHLSPFDDPKTYATVEREARIHGHSTPHMAANFAEYVGAKQLILTHFSPRYKVCITLILPYMSLVFFLTLSACICFFFLLLCDRERLTQ
jgi:ribonuclease Z